jgi:ABC-type glutathione transport system ATPase component
MLKMEENQAEQQGIYNHQLQDSLKAVILQLQALATVMGCSQLARDPNTNLYRHRKGILKLINFEYPETRIVGLVGNTGVGLFSHLSMLLIAKTKTHIGTGKSSVINSILGGNSLARTVIPSKPQ